MKIKRKIVVGTFATISLTLVAGSVAYACVPFKGKMTATVSQGTGGATIGNSGTHEGKGGTNNHLYCSTGTDVTPNSPATAGLNNVLTITIAAGTSTGCVDSLAQGWQSVYINNATSDGGAPFSATGTSWSFRDGTGCWASPTPGGRIALGSLSVNGSGAGTGTYTLTALNRVDNATTYRSGLCVGTSSAGIIIPIRVNAIV